MPHFPAFSPLQALMLLIPLAGLASCQNQVKPGIPANDPTLKEIISPLRSIDFGDTDYTDLEPLRKAIGEASIVFLGEQTHGESSTFAAKARLVRFLHEEMGFDLLMLESGLFDGVKAWQAARAGASLRQAVQNSIFYMYARSAETKPLFDYMDSRKTDARPLVFTAMDCYHWSQFALDNLTREMEAFFTAGGSALVPGGTWSWAKSNADFMIGRGDFKMLPGQLAKYKAFLDSLIAELPTLKVPPSTEITGQIGFWEYVIRGVRLKAEITIDTAGARRDSLMAANAKWLLENPYQGKKAIIWTHNLHAYKSFQGVREIVRDRDWSPVKSMGEHLVEAYGDKVYVLGFTAREGNYVNYYDGKEVSKAAQDDGRIENGLEAGLGMGFLDLRDLPPSARWLHEERVVALVDFIAFRAVVPKLMDGIIYFKTSSPSVQLQP